MGARVWRAVVPGALALLLAAALGLAAVQLGEDLPLAPAVLFLLVGTVTLPLLWAGLRRLLRARDERLQALLDALDGLAARDFSVRLAPRREDEIGALARAFNRVADVLGEERASLAERELLLESALETSPLAIVLADPLGRVVFSNPEARRLLVGGAELEGLAFETLLEGCPEGLRSVLAGEGDGLFTVDSEDGTETYHLSRRAFQINRRRYTLYLLRRLTRELDREEARIWKKVIRIISHELNNSLAPISSLAHSAGVVLERRSGDPVQLAAILAMIEERVRHLTGFLDGYARFARLPVPRKELVAWAPLLDHLRELYAFDLVGTPPETGWFDPTQLEQVLINLLKNAWEASAAAPAGLVELQIAADPEGGTLIQVLDRGSGMSEAAKRQALLPFYSTKPDGVGVGLPLCREILAGHGGTLALASRPGGGTVVTCRLPGAG